MKNLRSYIVPEEINEYVYSLWQTDLFRESHRSKSFIGRVVEEFAWMPRFFAEASNDHLERAHFCTWWGVIMLRDDYTNPYIHDLYLLHEMYHAARMPYIPNIGAAAFDEKMQRNELEASVLSEIQVYFELPKLRGQSFDYTIYADRFLDDPNMAALWRYNPVVAIETIRSMRRDVMVSKAEVDMDITEQWIRRFSEQNAVWRLTWSDRYLDVENHMAEFQRDVLHRDRFKAAVCHEVWLLTEAAKDPVDNIPFRQEAELFATFYWANKAKYAKAMEAAAAEKAAA